MKQIVGGMIYDALLARCALEVEVDEIYTCNERHFRLLGDEIHKRVKAPSIA